MMFLKKYILSLAACQLVMAIAFLAVGFVTGIGNLTSRTSLFFAKPEYLNLTFLLIPLYLGFIFFQWKGFRIHTNLSSTQHSNPPKVLFQSVKFTIFTFGVVCIILAMAQPVYGKKKVGGVSRTMELVVCLDISNSMNTKDIENTSRLDISKRALNALIDQLSGEKIGLCIFAGNALVQLPLTSDYNTARMFIDDIQTSYVSEQGTDVVAAMDIASTMFSKEPISKAILLITDGENHQAPESEIYSYLRQEKIQLCILGIGTASGGPIPEDVNYPEYGFKKDKEGFTVISKMNPTFIRHLAEKCNGTAIVTNEAYPDITTILTEINRMKRTKSRNLDFEISASVYEYPVLAGLMAFFGWILMFKRKAYD
ncbi:MAG: VWA domain-containing protein [Flavobacteriia bacterium]|nr:VWA domain-containing protein [Flavobacteriia bacterium]NBV67960.1 VWA domain-containing protein [Flavobacteriia bacterium]NBY40023.1 VWA domain-containing protein [Flavobacteriia bacterium]